MRRVFGLLRCAQKEDGAMFSTLLLMFGDGHCCFCAGLVHMRVGLVDHFHYEPVHVFVRRDHVWNGADPSAISERAPCTPELQRSCWHFRGRMLRSCSWFYFLILQSPEHRKHLTASLSRSFLSRKHRNPPPLSQRCAFRLLQTLCRNFAAGAEDQGGRSCRPSRHHLQHVPSAGQWA